MITRSKVIAHEAPCAVISAKMKAGPVAAPLGWRSGPLWAELFRRSLVHLGHVVPVHQVVEESLEVVGPPVAVVDVVRMLPDVAAEDRLGAMHQRVLAVRRLGDDDLAVLDGEPAPAGAELG